MMSHQNKLKEVKEVKALIRLAMSSLFGFDLFEEAYALFEAFDLDLSEWVWNEHTWPYLGKYRHTLSLQIYLSMKLLDSYNFFYIANHDYTGKLRKAIFNNYMGKRNNLADFFDFLKRSLTFWSRIQNGNILKKLKTNKYSELIMSFVMRC